MDKVGGFVRGLPFAKRICQRFLRDKNVGKKRAQHPFTPRWVDKRSRGGPRHPPHITSPLRYAVRVQY